MTRMKAVVGVVRGGTEDRGGVGGGRWMASQVDPTSGELSSEAMSVSVSSTVQHGLRERMRERETADQRTQQRRFPLTSSHQLCLVASLSRHLHFFSHTLTLTLIRTNRITHSRTNSSVTCSSTCCGRPSPAAAATSGV